MQGQRSSMSLAEIQAQQRLAFNQKAAAAYNAAFGYFIEGSKPNRDLIAPHSNAVLKAALDFFKRKDGIKQRLAQSFDNDSISFSLTRPASDSSSRQGSFHRSRRSVFMNIGELDKNNWLITLVHELAHAKDDVMFESLKSYNQPELVNRLVAWSNSGVRYSNLAASDKAQIHSWLLAGLQRGFLAEYRAWLLTYLVYQEGIADGSFQPIPWLEQISSSKPTNLSIELHILHYLSPSWKDPTTEIFGHTLVQEALAEVRAELLKNPCQIELGEVGKIIGLENLCQ